MAEEMKSIKQVADELHVSKVYVSKLIDTLGMRDSLVMLGNRYYLHQETYKAVIRAYDEKSKKRYKTTSEAEKTSSEASESLIKALQAQLDRKDAEIDRLMSLLEEKDKQQAELIKAVQQGHYLLAESTKVNQTEDNTADDNKDAENVSEEPKTAENIGILGRFKRFIRG